MPALRRAAVAPVLWVLSLGACQKVDYPLPEFPGTTGEASSGSTSPFDDPTEDVPAPSSNSNGDTLPQYDCSPANTNSCPEGQKCTAVSKGGLQNVFECVGDDGELEPYDACTPAPENGQDRCLDGTVCLNFSGQSPAGRCFPGCQNDSDCEPGLCVASPFTATTYCATSCDPEAPDCPQGLGCRQAKDRFVCEMGLESDIGGLGDACDETTLRGCAATLACLPGALIPGCASSSCCTATCNLDNPDTCDSPTICAALFTDPAPDFTAVGACFVPA